MALSVTDLLATDKINTIRTKFNSLLDCFDDLTFDGYGNLTIGTNLTIDGLLELTDDEITLNEGETGAGVTSGVAQIRIDRGSSDDAILRFDESDDLWKVGTDGGSFTALSLVGHNHDDRYFTETEITTNYYTKTNVDTLLEDYFLLDGSRALQGNLMLDGYWISDDGGDEGIRVDSDGEVEISDHIRASTTRYRRYYHLPMTAANAVAGGATWVSPNANHSGGWRVTNAAHILAFEADVHADWDGASDITVEIYFALNASGSNNDTVDLKIVTYYSGVGETSCKTQTVEVPTVTDGVQYKVYKVEFTLDYDKVDNVIEVGDKIGILLNIETDTSEIDDVVILSGSFYYNTTHVGIEEGDV